MVRQAFRVLRHRRLRNRLWWRTLTKPLFDRHLWVPCRDTVASGIAIGLFFAMMPMPFQMLAAAIMSMRFKANVPFAMAACWVSNPLSQGPIWLAQFRIGQWMRETLGVPMPGFLSNVELTVPKVGDLNAASFILGAISSGLLLVVLTYPVVHLFAVVLPHYLPVRKLRAVRRMRREGHLVEGKGEGI